LIQDDGSLEIHVPPELTVERPAFSHSHQSFDLAIEDHPLGKKLPRATATASLHLGPQEFRSFAAREDAPATLEDLLSEDTPQLSLHITSFSNATLVALSWPHTLMDVMGQQALLHAWSLVLAGREADVPPALGAREDIMWGLAEAAVEEEYLLKPSQLKGFNMATFGMRFAWDLLWNRLVETRTICLPKQAMEILRLQARSDLTTMEADGKTLFVSDGDVLTAWGIRAVASSLPQPRPITALHALNARFRLSALANAPGVYLTNMAVAVFTFLSPEVATGPLGPIALENRRRLAEQATEGQVLAGLRELREEQSPGNIDPATMLYSDANAVLMPFTNWTKADLYKSADFSAAIVRAGEDVSTRNNPPGTMVFHHASSMRQGPTVRNVIVVLGKDHADNYWLTGSLLPRTWERIEESIKNMQLER
jgi:hypothetical protein